MFSSAIVNFEMYDKEMFDLDEISKICTLIIDMTCHFQHTSWTRAGHAQKNLVAPRYMV